MDAKTDRNPTGPDTGKDEVIELIELLYFAYRDFTSDPDVLLLDYGFGRAHHRVIHFVGRNSGVSVAELLELLRITKQSLARVLRELIKRDIVEQHAGSEDKRKRLLYLTDQGTALHRRLMAPQIDRVERALRYAGTDSGPVFQQVLYGLINEDERERVEKAVQP